MPALSLTPASEVDTAQPQAPLTGDHTVDVAIAGGGYLGTAVASAITQQDPSLAVAVIESHEVPGRRPEITGEGMESFTGLGFGTTTLLRGREFLQQAYSYMHESVAHLRSSLIQAKLRPPDGPTGLLRVAVTPTDVGFLRHHAEYLNSLGFSDIEWLDHDGVQRRVNSDRYLGALRDPTAWEVNRAQVQEAQKRNALGQGARLFKNSPVIAIRKVAHPRAGFRVLTPRGSLTTAKLVLAVDSYSHVVPAIANRVTPAATYLVRTEPLSHAQLGAIGWSGREAIEDSTAGTYAYHLDGANCLVMAHSPLSAGRCHHPSRTQDRSVWKEVENHIQWLWPNLDRLRVVRRWGGPYWATTGLVPALGYLGEDRSAVYGFGGQAQSALMSSLNGEVLAELVLVGYGELARRCPFLNRRMIPWPSNGVAPAAEGEFRGFSAAGRQEPALAALSFTPIG
jgi:glycine/D-amino acid oxidase-like deaminating enzyme